MVARQVVQAASLVVILDLVDICDFGSDEAGAGWFEHLVEPEEVGSYLEADLCLFILSGKQFIAEIGLGHFHIFHEGLVVANY